MSNAGILLVGVATLFGLPGAGYGQSVNYPELETMFSEPVTTSVTGKPQRASDAPAALTIITREDIRRSPAKDIVGLLRAYAGVDVGRWTGHQSDVGIRGGVQPYNSRLLVMVNGRQVYLDLYGMTNWAGIGVQLEEIQQIEIVRGPNSALFGFNALSGVINIITVNPLHQQQVTATAEAGNEGYSRLSASAAVKLGAIFGLRLSGGYGKADELDGIASSPFATVPGGLTTNPKHWETAGEFYAQLGPRTDAGISVNHSRTHGTEIAQIPYLLSGRYHFTSIAARVSHDTGWGVLSGSLFHNWSDVQVPGVSGMDFNNRVFVASAQALIRAGTSNNFRVGLEYRANRLSIKPGFPGDTHYKIYAASGTWEGAIRDGITLTLAGRVDRLLLGQDGPVDQPSIFSKEDYERTITEWSFNSALLFVLGQSDTVRVAAGRGIQTPSLYSLGSRNIYGFSGPFPRVIQGDPTLDPTATWSGEISYMRPLSDGTSRLQLTAFVNHTKDIVASPSFLGPLRAMPPAYPFIAVTPANVGTFTAYGLEASLSGKAASGIDWAINYSWTKADQQIRGNEKGGPIIWPVGLEDATPEHKIRAQASYERGDWLGTMAVRYTSATSQLYAAPLTSVLTVAEVDDSIAIDAKLAFRATDRLTLEIAGENLTGSRQADRSPVAAERRLRGVARVRF